MSDEKPSGIQETFISHLVELRTRLVRASAVVLVVFIVLFTVWPGASVLYDFMAQPMLHALPEGSKMIATGVITPFMVPMKITMVAALMISLPWVLYQAWAFVAPGLYMHEKRLVAPLIFSSTILFILGVAF
jgi:sec-independent protein translocase protein TatC